MSSSGDRDHVVEAALEVGRKVAVFAAEVDRVDELNLPTKAAFERA